MERPSASASEHRDDKVKAQKLKLLLPIPLSPVPHSPTTAAYESFAVFR